MTEFRDTLAKIDGVQVAWGFDQRGKVLGKTISDFTDDQLKEISTLLASLSFMHKKNSGTITKLHYRYKQHQLWSFTGADQSTALIADADADIASAIEGL